MTARNYITLFLVLICTTLFAEMHHFATESFKVYSPCDACKTAIENSIKVEGVHNAQWDIKTQILTVTYNSHEISIDQIHSLIAKSGYDTDKVKATVASPTCCKK